MFNIIWSCRFPWTKERNFFEISAKARRSPLQQRYRTGPKEQKQKP